MSLITRQMLISPGQHAHEGDEAEAARKKGFCFSIEALCYLDGWVSWAHRNALKFYPAPP